MNKRIEAIRYDKQKMIMFQMRTLDDEEYQC